MYPVVLMPEALRRPLTLDSSTSKTADTNRLIIRSYQKQEPENQHNGGETIWLDLGSPLAKSMITWRLPVIPGTRDPYPLGHNAPDAHYQRVVWVGAHWFAQNQADDANPDDIHGHWSVEVPDLNKSLQTRFAIDFYDPATNQVGVEQTRIYTNRAALEVRSGEPRDGGLKMTGFREFDKLQRWYSWNSGSRSEFLRWAQVVTTEDGSRNGANYEFQRYDNWGNLLDKPLVLRRDTGEVEIAHALVFTGSPVVKSPAGTIDLQDLADRVAELEEA